MSNLVMKSVDTVKFYYYQYTLVTSLYMLESWERKLFNSVLIFLLMMAAYTTSVFMPPHIYMWKRVLFDALGSFRSAVISDLPVDPVNAFDKI